MPSNPSQQTSDAGEQAWLFQSNPEYYELDRALRELPAVEWTVRGHVASVHVGDRAYIWRAGTHAGVVAVGTVLTISMVIDPSLSSRIYRFDLRSSEDRDLIWRHDCHPGHDYLGSGLYHLHQGPDEANRVPDGPQTQVPVRMTTSAGPTHPPPRLATNS